MHWPLYSYSCNQITKKNMVLTACHALFDVCFLLIVTLKRKTFKCGKINAFEHKASFVGS